MDVPEQDTDGLTGEECQHFMDLATKLDYAKFQNGVSLAQGEAMPCVIEPQSRLNAYLRRARLGDAGIWVRVNGYAGSPVND